tara:strand:- start:1006 stop:1524 length:519 start_codon:yes stop_codon:yes gene_type:complete
MSLKKILKIGDKRLLRKASLVKDFNSDNLNKIIQEMFNVMREANGAGLAAPQLGINLQIIIFGFEKNLRYPNESSIPETILINPMIEILSTELIDGWEGCLSIPGFKGLVPRYEIINYSGFDKSGKKISRTVNGFHARVVQHECDHLNGILYPMRIKDLTKFGFIEALDANF